MSDVFVGGESVSVAGETAFGWCELADLVCFGGPEIEMV